MNNVRMLKPATFAFILLLVTSEAQAVCDCATSQTSPWCTGSSISMSSGQGTGIDLGSAGDTMVVNFATTYTCGQYATGDFWVVGTGSPSKVDVSSTTPGWDGNRHGWDANPVGCHHLDNRNQGRCTPVTPTLPAGGYDVSGGPVSFLKVIGRDSDSVPGGYLCHFDINSPLRESCVKYSRVVTFVSAVPDSDADNSTADEFRPGLSGTTKLGPYRTDMLTTSLTVLGQQSAGAVATEAEVSFVEIANRYSCAHWYMWKDNTTGQFFQETLPTDCLSMGAAQTDGQLTYGNNIAVFNRVVPLRFALNDFNYAGDTTHRAALIRAVQHGLDLASQFNNGFRTRHANPPLGAQGVSNPGGIHVGHKDPVAFAAFMLNQSPLTTVAGANHYFESDQIYTSSVDGKFYAGTGYPNTTSVCPDTGADNLDSRIHCYQVNERMDASCRSVATSLSGYFGQTSNSAPYTALWVQLFGAQSKWSHTDWLAWARAWREGGRAVGHTQYRWDNNLSANGCTNTRDHTGYESPFGNEMWAAFKNTNPGPAAPSVLCSNSGPIIVGAALQVAAAGASFTNAASPSYLFDMDDDGDRGTCTSAAGAGNSTSGTCNAINSSCTCVVNASGLSVGSHVIDCEATSATENALSTTTVVVEAVAGPGMNELRGSTLLGGSLR